MTSYGIKEREKETGKKKKKNCVGHVLILWPPPNSAKNRPATRTKAIKIQQQQTFIQSEGPNDHNYSNHFLQNQLPCSVN